MFKKILSYAIAIVIPVGVGLLAAYLTKDSMDIYQSVVKPKLAPPGILFPIVWSILYVLMGVSSGMVYNGEAPTSEKAKALTVYGVQLAVNFFWSILFFNKRLFLASFVLLLGLWALILATFLRFYKINKVAAWLQLPYLTWVTFAGYLNLAIYLLN